MSFFEFPHTRTYDSDLGWLIWSMKKLIGDMTEFTEINSIKFADPINWNIAAQYEPTTIVVDDEGNGYISRKAVPSGVALTDNEYWTRIFNFSDITDTIRNSIAVNAGDSATAPVALYANDLVWWNGNIYKVLYDIVAGTAFIDGTNVTPYTVNARIQEVGANIENIEQGLQTEIEDRTEADAALNEAIETETAARETADTEIRNIIDGLTFDAEYKTYDIAGRTIKTKIEKTGSYQLTDSVVLKLADIVGSYSGFYIQSAEYIGQNRILIGMSTSGYNDSLLVVINTNTLNIIDRINMDLGHCNDLAWDSANGKIYVATMGTGALANTIAVLNANTIQLIGQVQAGGEVYKIAYDKENNIVYDVRDNSGVLILEIREPDTLNIIASYSIISPTIPNLTSQGSVCIDGNFYYIDCVYGADNGNAGAYLTNYNPVGVKGKTFAFNTMAGDEPEGITIDDNYIYIFSHSYVSGNIHMYKYPLQNNSSVDLNTILTGYGKILRDGDDLNNLTDGKYIKVSGGVNVANWTPNINGGTIIQINGGYDHTFQIALLNTGQIFSRNRATSGASGTWTAWKCLNGAEMKGYYSFDLAGAYVSDAAKAIFGTIPMEVNRAPSINTLTATARSVTGSYIITAESLSGYNVAMAFNNGIARVTIRKQDGTAFSVTNNTPCAVNLVGTIA